MGWKFSVNEDRLYHNKFYPYYFKDNLTVNVVPIGFYTRLQAEYTLRGQFGNNWRNYFKVTTGKLARSKGWKLGKNSVKLEDGTRVQIKKIYIPPEFNVNKGTRFVFRRKLYKVLNDKKRSSINRFLKEYYFKTI